MSAAADGGFAQLTQGVLATLERLRAAREVTVGCSQRREVLRLGKTTLQHYQPLPGVRPAGRRPLLICFALVNRPYVLDLQPDRSLIRRLLEGGRSVYLIDWGETDESDRHTTLEDYVLGSLGGCIRYLRESSGGEAVDVLGVCQGGTFALCYTALHPGDVARLVTLTAPVDFHTPENLLSRWVRGVDTELLKECGNVPGDVLNALFLALMPVRLTQHKYVRLLTGAPDQRAVEDFVRMERWIFDSPPQAAAALAQFVRLFYQENALLRGTLSLAQRPVRLTAVNQPLLNLYAAEDHIVPPSASAALRGRTTSSDYSEESFPTGHIGMYVSRAGREGVPRRILEWLRARE
ncbi:MAG: class III poly(R)-hydroxyalkanoic acid synthase subunit PhaC [Proteobacteria bacterium]|nr:class III poly(R)-hydroxyalkanoic acid synthase subunit PhaC [Pseudomonadota bacterium]